MLAMRLDSLHAFNEKIYVYIYIYTHTIRVVSTISCWEAPQHACRCRGSILPLRSPCTVPEIAEARPRIGRRGRSMAVGQAGSWQGVVFKVGEAD